MSNAQMTNDEALSPFGPWSLVPWSFSQLGGAGFEPAKAEPSDLQSDPFDRFGNPPGPAVSLVRLPPKISPDAICLG